ncbi:MAG: phosphoethanolamine transferase CptA [Spongiibacteraceae bacterium]
MKKTSLAAGLISTYLFFFYFSGCTHLLMKISGHTTSVGLRQALYMSLLWFIPLFTFPRHQKAITGGIGILLWLSSLISLGYYCIYQQTFSTSVLFIIFESNIKESSEFIGQYFRWWMIPVLIAHTAIALLLWRRVKPIDMSLRARSITCVVIALFLFVAPVASNCSSKRPCTTEQMVDRIQKRMEPAEPWQFIMGYAQYRKQLQEMENLRQANAALPPLNGLVDHNINPTSTLVLIIGESTNRGHMGIYGYSRDTTPRLSAIKNELLLFDNVVSSRPTTIESLIQVLSFADQEHPTLYLEKPTLMNMMKQAGYRSYWITNQQTLTRRNTMLTNFSQQTDEQFYMNTSREQNSRQYDTNVLAPLAKVLKEDAPKKFIVIHLLGTHLKYEYRYPEEYDVFKDASGVTTTHDEAKLKYINRYDNAVLFNDFVVSSIIEQLRSTNTPTRMAYFSDHGEDVYDSPPHHILGRNESIPTAPMYTIPMIVWSSSNWQDADEQAAHMRANLHRPYSNAHFIHSWADMANISFDELDRTKSFASPLLKDYPLIVGDPFEPKTLRPLPQ